MIGGVFLYNHKGEVLISRVYRDSVTWVSPIFPFFNRLPIHSSINHYQYPSIFSLISLPIIFYIFNPLGDLQSMLLELVLYTPDTLSDLLSQT